MLGSWEAGGGCRLGYRTYEPIRATVSTWGIIPAAGEGSRIQPLGFSKALLPVGSRFDDEAEHPRALAEHLVERMIAGGARKICFVVSPDKSDICEYFGERIDDVEITYVVQPRPVGLCDALFRASGVVGEDENVLIGLPDTLWFPVEGFDLMPDNQLSLLLFPVRQPQLCDAVLTDSTNCVCEICVGQLQSSSFWTWGAVKMPGHILHCLHELWRQPGHQDENFGTLVNAYLAQGGTAVGVRAGIAYVDVDTVAGYRDAIRLVSGAALAPIPSPQPAQGGYTDGWRPLTAANYASTFPQQRIELEPLHRSER